MKVIGGGALGLSAALALAERGHDVTLVEKDRLGEGSTARAAGIVSTMTWNDDDHRLVQETRGRLGELISLAMIEGQDARSTWKGTASLLAGRAEDAYLIDVRRRLERLGEEVEVLGAGQAEAEYPLRFGADEEVLVAQEDGYVEADGLVALLRGRLEAEGVDIVENSHAEVLDDEPTIVAGGPWTKRLLPELPLLNFRTQLASIEHAGEVPILHDLTNGVYLRPDGGSSLLCGNGTRLHHHEPDAFDTATDPEFKDHIAAALTARLRDSARWRTGWSGLCAATPDRRPLCGPVPDADVFVLSGDNGFGLMRCLALGERLADAVDGDVHPETDPARFGDAPPLDFPMREGYAP